MNPYGAAKAYAHLAVDVYRRRGLHAVSAILYNHESPRRPEQFVTRKITRTVAAIAQRRGRPAHARQPRRPARLGLGTRLRRRDGAGRSGRGRRRLRGGDRRGPLGARLRGRRVRSRRHRRLGAARATSIRRSSGPRTPPSSPATRPGPATGSAGHRRSASRSWSAGWSTATSGQGPDGSPSSAAPAGTRRTRSSSAARRARRSSSSVSQPIRQATSSGQPILVPCRLLDGAHVVAGVVERRRRSRCRARRCRAAAPRPGAGRPRGRSG